MGGGGGELYARFIRTTHKHGVLTKKHIYSLCLLCLRLCDVLFKVCCSMFDSYVAVQGERERAETDADIQSRTRHRKNSPANPHPLPDRAVSCQWNPFHLTDVQTQSRHITRHNKSTSPTPQHNPKTLTRLYTSVLTSQLSRPCVGTHNAYSIPRSIPRGIIKVKQCFMCRSPRPLRAPGSVSFTHADSLLLFFIFFSPTFLQIHFCAPSYYSLVVTYSFTSSITVSRCRMFFYYILFTVHCASCISPQRWLSALLSPKT